MSIGILALALLLGLVILAFWLRGGGAGADDPYGRDGGRRRLPAPGAYPGWDDDDATLAYEEPAVSATARDLARPNPYATLAASPDPVGPVEVGDEGARGAEPG